MSKKPWNQFVVMWDCYGLEAVVPVPNPADTTFALLQNKEPPAMPNIFHMRLRAQYNPQRNYEIYVVNATHGISQEDIVSMFDADPQNAAETIRRLGNCFYNGRSTQKQVIS
jgi:hypothetical protein